MSLIFATFDFVGNNIIFIIFNQSFRTSYRFLNVLAGSEKTETKQQQKKQNHPETVGITNLERNK